LACHKPYYLYIYNMKCRLILLILLFPSVIFSQPFYGDTIWAKDYSSTGAFSCAFSPDGSRLAVAYECMGPMVRIIDVYNGHVMWESETPDLCLYNIQFSSNGQYIAVAEELGHLVVIDMTIPDTAYNIDTQTGGLNGVDFSNDGNFIYAGGNDGSIRIFETETGMLHHSIPNAHNDAVLSVDVSAFGNYLVTGSKDNTIKVWDLNNSYQLMHTFTHAMDDIKSVKFYPAENRILAGSADDMLYVYNMPAGDLDTMLMFHTGDVNTVDISADATFAVAGANDQSISMFSLYDYSLMETFTNALQTRVYGVAISPDMTKLAAANHIGFVLMYDIHSLVGMEENSTIHFSIYPNPVTEQINISGLTKQEKYSITDLNGSITQKGNTTSIIQVDQLPAGVYILEIGGKKEKFVKE